MSNHDKLMNRKKKTVSLLSILLTLSTLFIFFSSLSPKPCLAQENPCLSCHTKFKERAKSVHAALGLGCQTCHKQVEGKSHPDQKGSMILIQKMPELCYTCHDGSKFKGNSVHTPVSSGMCTGCHDPHQSNYNKILLKDVPGLCYNCHDASRFKGKYGHAVIGMCTGCHNPHASKSGKLLTNDVPNVCYDCHEKAKFTKKHVHAVVTMPGGCSLCRRM